MSDERTAETENVMNNVKLTRGNILYLANQCVCRDRNTQYGEPEDVFEDIAAYWNIYLKRRHRNLKPSDVSAMMALLKVARLNPNPDVDNTDTWVDIAGYAACGGELDADS